MLNSSASVNPAQGQVYGFLCQKTKVFYAFESFETYQEFIVWLKREKAAATNDIMQNEEPCLNIPPNEVQQLADF